MNKPGFIAVAKYDNTIAYEIKSGVERLGKKDDISVNSVFNIASLSKQFTAFAILLLEFNGQIGLDDSVLKYLPKLGQYAKDITIRHLIYHTSGLKDYLEIVKSRGIGYTSHLSIAEILEDIYCQTTKDFETGTKFQYSNTGYFLLGQIIEKVSELKLSKFLKQYIFMPLNMSNTYVAGDNTVSTYSVMGYKQKNNFNSYEISQSPWANIGDSGIYSSAADLLKWGENFSECIIGTKKIIERMLSILPNTQESGYPILNYQPYAFGLGLEYFMGERLYDHGGSWLGVESYFMRFVDAQLTVVVLSNLEGLNVEKIAYDLAGKVLIK